MATRGRKKLPPEEMPISAQQELFIEEYLVTRNGKQSAIKAGYSPHTAKVQASTLLAEPHIKLAMDARIEEIKQTNFARIQKVRDETYRLAVEDPNLTPTERIRAIDQFCKQHGMHIERVEHTGLNGGPIQTIGADATPTQAIEVYATLIN